MAKKKQEERRPWTCLEGIPRPREDRPNPTWGYRLNKTLSRTAFRLKSARPKAGVRAQVSGISLGYAPPVLGGSSAAIDGQRDDCWPLADGCQSVSPCATRGYLCPLSSQQIRPIVRISIDAALGLSYDFYATEQRLVSNNNQSSMTNRRSFVTASGVHILPNRSLDGRHTRRPRGSSTADYAKQSQSVDLPFGSQHRSCETTPISFGRQGRDGLATETHQGVTRTKSLCEAKPNLGGMGYLGKVNATCGTGSTGEGIVRNKANYGPAALGLRIVDCGFRIERWESALAGDVATSRSERAKQSQFA